MRDQLLTNNLTGSFEVTVLEVAQYTKGINIFIIGMASTPPTNPYLPLLWNIPPVPSLDCLQLLHCTNLTV